MSTDKLITIAVFGGLLFIFDAIILGIIFFTRRKVAQASSWPSTIGTVLISTVQAEHNSDGEYSYYPVVQYTYQVMGQTHQGNRIMPGLVVGGSGANKVVARYPMGAQVTVYYDPDKPSDAVLERGMPGHIKWLWAALVCIDLFLCGLGGVLTVTF